MDQYCIWNNSYHMYSMLQPTDSALDVHFWISLFYFSRLCGIHVIEYFIVVSQTD